MIVSEKVTSKNPAICVFTGRGLEKVLEDGGSQAWVLDAQRARQHEYVVCVQNRGGADDWGNATASHHTAFMVGRLRAVQPSMEDDCEKRWILVFSEYAEINIPEVWPGYRNPVFYTDLEALNINPNTLEFKPMPVPKAITLPAPVKTARALSIAEAKEGLAMTFGVDPSSIEITVRL